MKASDFTWIMTRPILDAKIWQQTLTDLKIESVLFPCLEILGCYSDSLDTMAIESMEKADLFIITSPNSVRYMPENGLQILKKHFGKIISIGSGTTAALNQYSIQPNFTAGRDISSEKLLELESLKTDMVRHKNILLLSGQGGRNLLQEQLQRRGAMVQKLMLYQRLCPRQPNLDILHQLKSKPPLFLMTSQTALINLLKLIPSDYHDWLKQQKFMVVSQRLKDFVVQQKIYSVVNGASTCLEELVNQFP